MPSDVYILRLPDGAPPLMQAKAMERLYDVCGLDRMINPNHFVAIKLHVGEIKNTTHIVPEVAQALIQKAWSKEAFPFCTETSTLYKCERENAVKHILHAVRHGFSIEKIGAPFIMADGLTGDAEIEIAIDGELNKSVMVAREARMADCLFIVSHPTGHIVTGFGGAIKNLGMGLTSRKGKLRQHSTMKPEIDRGKCVMCGKCIRWCPVKAITSIDNKAKIDPDICIGCGECLAVCQFHAVRFNWGTDSVNLQKQIAEHALGVVKDKTEDFFYFNVAINMTTECDCMNMAQKKAIPDMGILASRDPVAIDTATMDLTGKNRDMDLGEMALGPGAGRIQLEHGEKIGLGTREYRLIEVDF